MARVKALAFLFGSEHDVILIRSTCHACIAHAITCMSSFFTALADSKIFSEIQELLLGVFNCLVVSWGFDDLCVFKIYDWILLPSPTDNLYSEHDISFGGANDNAIVSSRSLFD